MCMGRKKLLGEHLKFDSQPATPLQRKARGHGKAQTSHCFLNLAEQALAAWPVPRCCPSRPFISHSRLEICHAGPSHHPEICHQPTPSLPTPKKSRRGLKYSILWLFNAFFPPHLLPQQRNRAHADSEGCSPQKLPCELHTRTSPHWTWGLQPDTYGFAKLQSLWRTSAGRIVRAACLEAALEASQQIFDIYFWEVFLGGAANSCKQIKLKRSWFSAFH